jgi:probable HAF family extracellular repeat protein
MNSRCIRTACAIRRARVLLLALAASQATIAAADPQYQVFFIESPAASFTSATDINDDGVVLGVYVEASGDAGVFLWSESEGFIDLPSPEPFTTAAALNECNVAVGRYDLLDGSGDTRALRWLPGAATPEELGVLGTFVAPGGAFTVHSSDATGINDRGQIVGNTSSPRFRQEAFLWTERREMIPLGTLGGDFSMASDINNFGHVVGQSSTAEGDTHAFLWTPGRGMRDLGALNEPGFTFSQSAGINDLVRVTGLTTTPDSEFGHAFLWSPRRGMEDLDAGSEDTASQGQELNETGKIVGAFSIGESPIHAAVWQRGRPRLDLTAGSPLFSAARAINNPGTIVGFVSDENGEFSRATVWTPRQRNLLERTVRSRCLEQ